MRSGVTAFELPGGWIGEDGQRRTRAELRGLSGIEEDWVATHAVPSAIAVTNVLGSCLVRLEGFPSDRNLARQLLVGDRDFLMLQLRRMTLGEAIHAIIGCPGCGQKMDVDFGVADVPIKSCPLLTGDFSIESCGRSIRFRLPTGADQEAGLDFDQDSAARVLLERCVLEDGGKPLSSEDRVAVVDAMDRYSPQVDLELDLTCPECRLTFAAPFDTTAFFLQEMRIGAKRLLRETHLLAFYYHWSEAEILAMSRARRRAYLDLLGDELKRE